uniref:Patatin-like phospholipase domain containing 4 n=1 Tax=Cyprinus carpio TaxID=7962 RepID=A0A8C2BEJ1_CYPCA
HSSNKFTFKCNIIYITMFSEVYKDLFWICVFTQHCKEFTYSFASNVRSQRFGAVTPGYDFLEGIGEILPPSANQLTNECLHVSITHSKMHKNNTVSSFSSREDLIKVLLASCFVSVYAGVKPVEFQGQREKIYMYIGSLPIITYTMSPFSGPQDISPAHKFSKDNITRLNQALFPPSLPRLNALEQEGYQDAVDFLKKDAVNGCSSYFNTLNV